MNQYDDDIDTLEDVTRLQIYEEFRVAGVRRPVSQVNVSSKK